MTYICKCGCGKEFEPSRSTQIFIDKKHTKRYWGAKEREQYKSVFRYNNYVRNDRADRRLNHMEGIDND